MPTLKQARSKEHKPWTKPWLLAGRRRAVPKGGRIEERDPEARGLYLVSQASGAQSWAFRYRRPGGKPAKLTLGTLDIHRVLAPGETAALGEPLTREMAQELASRSRGLLKRHVDPAVELKRQVADTADTLDNLRMDGWPFEQLAIKFMQTYPLVGGRRQREARESTKRQTALHLGLKPDGDGDWVPTGNGVLSHWRGRVFATHDGAPQLTRRDALTLIETLPPITGNRTLTALKLFGRWAEEREYVTVNPFATIRKLAPEADRDRTLIRRDEDGELVTDEIAAFWRAAERMGYPYGHIAQVVLLTGQRPGEVREARWNEFHSKLPAMLEGGAAAPDNWPLAIRTWTIPEPRMKARVEHKVPLSADALALLSRLPRRGPWLFMREEGDGPTAKQSKQATRLRELTAEELGREPDPWTLHDLRRTAATGMAELGIAPHVIDLVQAHALPGRQAAVYQRADRDAEKRAALDAWGRFVMGVVSGKPAGENVVPLRQEA